MFLSSVDMVDAQNKRYNVESVAEVVDRISELLDSLENVYEGKDIGIQYYIYSVVFL